MFIMLQHKPLLLTYILLLFHTQAIKTIIPPNTFSRWQIACNPTKASASGFSSSANSLHNGKQTEPLLARSNCSVQFRVSVSPNMAMGQSINSSDLLLNSSILHSAVQIFCLTPWHKTPFAWRSRPILQRVRALQNNFKRVCATERQYGLVSMLAALRDSKVYMTSSVQGDCCIVILQAWYRTLCNKHSAQYNSIDDKHTFWLHNYNIIKVVLHCLHACIYICMYIYVLIISVCFWYS